MRTEVVSFTGASGHPLSGRLDLPIGRVRATALFAHCFSCGKDLKSVKELTSRLTGHGFAVLRFDFTGLGQSEGDFADTHFGTNVDDLVVAADWLRQSYAPPALLVGHSLGGAAAIVAAGRIPELAGVATIGAPSDPAHVAHLFDDSALATLAEGKDDPVEASIAGRSFSVHGRFLVEAGARQLEACLADNDVPLLVLHALDDEIVDVGHGLQLFEWANLPKSFATLERADHLLTDPRQARRAADILAAWADDLVGTTPQSGDDVVPFAPEGRVLVTERGTGRFAQVVRVGERHALLADEPLGIGDDTGPAPYDFLLAGLGACTSMTLRMYADRKGWPLEGVAVRLSHDRIHADDCEACASASGRIDLIDREVLLEGPLDDEQRRRLLEIAERCPVHQTLESETRVATRLG